MENSVENDQNPSEFWMNYLSTKNVRVVAIVLVGGPNGVEPNKNIASLWKKK